MKQSSVNHHSNDYSRRDFLRFGWTLTAGVALPPLLHGCYDTDVTPGPTETQAVEVI